MRNPNPAGSNPKTLVCCKLGYISVKLALCNLKMLLTQIQVALFNPNP